MQKAVQGTMMRIQITTTGPAPHSFATLPVVEPVRAGLWAPGQGVTIYLYHHHEERFNGVFLHLAHRALMVLGPWEGCIVAFDLGSFFFLLTSP
jgi:hypothetical protein